MLPAPLQISLMAYQTNKKTNQWDYTVQLTGNKVAGSNMIKNDVYDFSSEFLEKIAINFSKGNVVAKTYSDAFETDPNSIELKPTSGESMWIGFESISEESDVVDFGKFLYNPWFKDAYDATLKILEIVLDENPKEQENLENSEKLLNQTKYLAEIFNYTVMANQHYSHNTSIGGDVLDDSEAGIKSVYINIISDIVGYNFLFDSTWTKELNGVSSDKNKALDEFNTAFKEAKISNVFKPEFLNYYNVNTRKKGSESTYMFRDIWASIQTNVYEQLIDQGLPIKYNRENTLFTLAKIGSNKLQPVNFTEVHNKDKESKKINNLVFDKKNSEVTDGDNLIGLDSAGNDIFYNSIKKYDNKFTAGNVKIELGNTDKVAYKLNGITTKKDSYNYSMFESKSTLSGELYIRENAFNELYTELAVIQDENKPVVGTNKSPLEMKSTFYLEVDDSANQSVVMSYLLGDVSNSKQNIFVIDTGNIFTKDESPQLKMITMVNLMTIIYSVIGVILFFLASVFMLYSQKEELTRTRKQLGVFKSNGYKTWELCIPSTVKVFLLMIIGLVAGYLFSFPLQINAVEKQFGGIGAFSIDKIYAHPVFLFVLLFVIPFIFTGVIFLILLKFLSEKPLDLMKPVSKPVNIKHPWWYWALMPLIFPFVLVHKLSTRIWRNTRFAFTFKLQAAFLSISKGKFTIVIILFSFATFLVSMEMKAIPVMNNMFNESTSFMDDKTNHESYINGDNIDIDNDGNWSVEQERFIGRKYIDLNGKTVDHYLEKQEALSSEQRELDDFVFDVHNVIDLMFKQRLEFLSDVREPDDARMELSSIFALGALLLPVKPTSESLEYYEKMVNDIEEFVNDPENSQEAIEEYSKEKVSEFFVEAKNAWLDPEVNYESLIFSTLHKDKSQIEKPKAIQANDIFKISWMLISGLTENVELAKLQTVNEVRQKLTEYMESGNNDQLRGSKPDKTVEEEIEELVEKIKEKLIEIISFLTDHGYMDVIEVAVTNSNFVQKLIQPLLLTDKDTDPLITNNAIVFDSKKETLVKNDEIRIEGHNFYSTLMAFDSNNDYGDIRRQYKFEGVANWSRLSKINADGSINVIITKPIAKIKNIGVGDEIEIYLRGNKENQKAVKGHVIGIQTTNIVTHTIYADYYAYLTAQTGLSTDYTYVDKEAIDPEKNEFAYKDVHYFNKVISQKKKVNLPISDIGFDFTEITKSFTFTQDSFSYMTFVENQDKALWFTSMIAGSNYLSKYLSINATEWKNKISPNSFFVDVPSMMDATSSYEIIKAGAQVMIKLITNMMIVNIVISLVLLLILFSVLIKIIISDAQGIIILMRSFGYKDLQINWIVIGKYLTYSVAAFIVMYIASYFTWIFIADLAWNKYAIILAIPTMYWLPFAIFAVMESVIAIGWLFGVYRLKKLPLARI